jgi:hypothetical protein
LNNHQEFINLIYNSKVKNYHEHNPNDVPVNLFFDLDIKKSESVEYFNDYDDIVRRLLKLVEKDFKSKYILQKIVIKKTRNHFM